MGYADTPVALWGEKEVAQWASSMQLPAAVQASFQEHQGALGAKGGLEGACRGVRPLPPPRDSTPSASRTPTPTASAPHPAPPSLPCSVVGADLPLLTAEDLTTSFGCTPFMVRTMRECNADPRFRRLPPPPAALHRRALHPASPSTLSTPQSAGQEDPGGAVQAGGRPRGGLPRSAAARGLPAAAVADRRRRPGVAHRRRGAAADAGVGHLPGRQRAAGLAAQQLARAGAGAGVVGAAARDGPAAGGAGARGAPLGGAGGRSGRWLCRPFCAGWCLPTPPAPLPACPRGLRPASTALQPWRPLPALQRLKAELRQEMETKARLAAMEAAAANRPTAAPAPVVVTSNNNMQANMQQQQQQQMGPSPSARLVKTERYCGCWCAGRLGGCPESSCCWHRPAWLNAPDGGTGAESDEVERAGGEKAGGERDGSQPLRCAGRRPALTLRPPSPPPPPPHPS